MTTPLNAITLARVIKDEFDLDVEVLLSSPRSARDRRCRGEVTMTLRLKSHYAQLAQLQPVTCPIPPEELGVVSRRVKTLGEQNFDDLIAHVEKRSRWIAEYTPKGEPMSKPVLNSTTLRKAFLDTFDLKVEIGELNVEATALHHQEIGRFFTEIVPGPHTFTISGTFLQPIEQCSNGEESGISPAPVALKDTPEGKAFLEYAQATPERRALKLREYLGGFIDNPQHSYHGMQIIGAEQPGDNWVCILQRPSSKLRVTILMSHLYTRIENDGVKKETPSK